MVVWTDLGGCLRTLVRPVRLTRPEHRRWRHLTVQFARFHPSGFVRLFQLLLGPFYSYFHYWTDECFAPAPVFVLLHSSAKLRLLFSGRLVWLPPAIPPAVLRSCPSCVPAIQPTKPKQFGILLPSSAVNAICVEKLVDHLPAKSSLPPLGGQQRLWAMPLLPLLPFAAFAALAALAARLHTLGGSGEGGSIKETPSRLPLDAARRASAHHVIYPCLITRVLGGRQLHRDSEALPFVAARRRAGGA